MWGTRSMASLVQLQWVRTIHPAGPQESAVLLAEAQAFVLQGQNVPVNWVWETPSDPSFAGFAYQIQSAVFSEGGFVGTNPAALILGF